MSTGDVKKPKYQDYKIDCIVIDRQTKVVYQIVKREHKERKVLLRLLESIEKWTPSHYKQTKWYSSAHHGMSWRTHKELNRFYSLLDRKVARVLYASR